MGRLLIIALAVAAAGIVVVTQNGPGKDKPEPRDAFTPAQRSTIRPDGTVSTPGQPVKAPAPVGATIVMRKLAFSPARATLRVGQSVRFVNKDTVTHAVLQDFGPRSGEVALIDTGDILPGQAVTVTISSPGTIRYLCTLHPTVMSGRLVVTGANS